MAEIIFMGAWVRHRSFCMVSRLSKPQCKFWCLFSWNPKVLKCFDSILVAKFLEIIICSMVEENLEHKGAFVLCTLFLVYVILCCIWKKEVSTFKYFPLYDTTLEEVLNSFSDMRTFGCGLPRKTEGSVLRRVFTCICIFFLAMFQFLGDSKFGAQER